MLKFIVFINLIAALGLCAVFVYLYRLYNERYMGIWASSWALFGLRIGLDLLRYEGYEQLILLLINQLASIGSVMLLLRGIYDFGGQPMPRGWLHAGVLGTVLTDVLLVLEFPIVWVALPTALVFGVAQIWTGILFCRAREIEGFGKLVTGKAFMLVGLLNMTYPFTSDVKNPEKGLVFFTIGFILWVVIFNGVLLVYFQRIRQELGESEKRFRLLAENARDMIYRFSFVPRPRFDYASAATYTILGYEPAELAEDPAVWQAVFQEKDFEYIQDVRNWIGANNKPLVMLLNRKDGTQIWTEQHVVPIWDSEGNLVAIEGILRDISERKHMEQEIMRLNQLNILGETAATIAHEIRNPMTTVHGFLQLLNMKEELASYKGWLAMMLEELERANSIISNYLSFSKAENVKLERRNLNCLVKAFLPLLESSTVMNSRFIEVDLKPVPNTNLDEKKVRQLIINLVQNALEAMEPGGTVKVSTYVEEQAIVLAVKDEGKGIAPEILERIGTPFCTTKENGTGLGLAVCYGIASLHGANITVETGREGTTFYVRFLR